MKFLGILKSLWKILKVLEVLKVRGISSEVRPGPKLILMDVMKLSEGADRKFSQGQRGAYVLSRSIYRFSQDYSGFVTSR